MTRTNTNIAVRAGGAWLAGASALMIAGIALHGPIAPDLRDRTVRIASRPTTWAVAHWIAAAGLSAHAVAGLIVLTSGSRLTKRLGDAYGVGGTADCSAMDHDDGSGLKRRW